MSFLKVEDKKYIVFGVANRRSVAWFIGKTLEDNGAKVIYVVRSEARLESTAKLLTGREVYVCDVEHDDQLEKVTEEISSKHPQIDGLVHSIAFANYSEGLKPFHQTLKRDFLQAVDISCFSLINISNRFSPYLAEDASIITISISTTRMASENYGYMGPIKAALDSSVVFLAKSLSQNVSPKIRVNAVGAGLLKTSASAGIPGYVDAYLFAEKATLRKEAVQTQEVADTAAFLISPASSGINSQTIVIDAGMSTNYFDKELTSNQ